MGNRAGMPIVDNLLFAAMEAENAKKPDGVQPSMAEVTR